MVFRMANSRFSLENLFFQYLNRLLHETFLLHQDDSIDISCFIPAPDHIDRKTILSCRFKNINAAGFHGRPYLVPVLAEASNVALLAKATGTRPHAPGLIVAIQKDLDLKMNEGFIKAFRLSPFIQSLME